MRPDLDFPAGDSSTDMGTSNSTQGSPLILILLPLLAATTFIAVATGGTDRGQAWRDETRAFYLAETGVEGALQILDHNGLAGLLAIAKETTEDVGTRSLEVLMEGEAPGHVRIRVNGASGQQQACVEAVLAEHLGESGEPWYERISWRVVRASIDPESSGRMFPPEEAEAWE